MLRVIQNLFSCNTANVLIDGFLSPDFEIKRGVLQGSKLGPVLFNLFINDLLDELNHTCFGAKINSIHIAALGFADDIVLISDNPSNLQRLLHISYDWTKKNLMAFHTSKCKIMIFNGGPKHARFTLGSSALKVVQTHKYLGVRLTSRYVSNIFNDYFHSILE